MKVWSVHYFIAHCIFWEYSECIGTVTGAGVLLKKFCETKNYKRKIEMSRYAYTTDQKILADLKTSLRSGPFNKQDFLKEVNILDDTIIDFCSLVTKFGKQYGKKFLSIPTTNSN